MDLPELDALSISSSNTSTYGSAPDRRDQANIEALDRPPTAVQQLDPYIKYLPLLTRATTLQGAAQSSLNIEDNHKLKTAPVFSTSVHAYAQARETFVFPQPPKEVYPQYGVLGILSECTSNEFLRQTRPQDNIIFSNTEEPWSAFICGSQGSGKSHTLSCLLENNLLPRSELGTLRTPLTGIIFHYDKFSNFNSGQVCEAAYLCSAGVPVQVLVAPTSLKKMTRQYTNLPGLPLGSRKPKVMPLYFSQEQLSVDVMMTLMAVHDTGVSAPLYISAIRQVLREIALKNQDTPGFNYKEFRQRLALLSLTEGQNAPLNMRLELLQSVLLESEQTTEAQQAYNSIWKFEPGTLTIVDLSDQFVNEEDACALFSICLKLFMDGWKNNPRIIALDEAHKFLTTSSEATKLTNDLVAIVRQQRHLSSRVIVATQEPTVSGDLLDLCNVSIVHRFNSPQWYTTIKEHLAGAHQESKEQDNLFHEIVKLNAGEALIFCPTAVLNIESSRPKLLQDAYAKARIRDRVSADGGQSILPSHQFNDSADNTAIRVTDFRRYNGANLPAPGSLAARGRGRGAGGHLGNGSAFGNHLSVNSHAFESSSVSSVSVEPNSLTSTGGASRRSSMTSTTSSAAGHKRQRSVEVQQQPAKHQKSTGAPLAIQANVYPRKPNAAVSVAQLENMMYNVIADKMYEKGTYNWGIQGFIGTALEQLSVDCGLPKEYLSTHKFGGQSNYKDGSELMKAMFQKYYDTNSVPRGERPNLPWLKG